MSTRSFRKNQSEIHESNNEPEIIDVNIVKPQKSNLETIDLDRQPQTNDIRSTDYNLNRINLKNDVENIESKNVNIKSNKIDALRHKQKGFFRKFVLPVITVLGVIILIISIVLGVAGYNVLTELSKISSGNTNGQNIFTDLVKINPFSNAEDEVSKLQGGSTGRINILLLGYGGEGHDGGLLTDSQLIISIFPKTKKVATINIPRDTYVSDNGAYKKMNSVYADAENKQKGTGANRVVKILENDLNTKIHYWATIDFKGFKKMIDIVGGVDIYVRNSFTDYEYPLGETYQYMYPAPSFIQGNTRMDGEKALIYARSRHAAGVEGGDFARSLRQREVITAMVKKGLDTGLISNPDKLRQLIATLSENLNTNLSFSEIFSLGKIFKDYNLTQNISSWTLSDDGVILCPQNNPDTGYILTYCDGSYFGSKTISSSKNLLQKNFENVLDVALMKKLDETDVAIVSNKSKVLSTLSSALKSYKSTAVLTNNQFSEITLSQNPEITIYYTDPESIEVYNYLSNQNIGLVIKKGDKFPENKTLPKSLSKAKIVYWIE